MTDKVTLAYAQDGHNYAASFSESLLHLMLHDVSHGQFITEGGYIPVRCGTNGLVAARNLAVETFLEIDKGDWLLWIDTDMGFEKDSVERLLAVAHPDERPIIGGLCFGQKETDEDGFHGYRTSARATIFNWKPEDELSPATFTARRWYPANTLVPCAGTGSAFILIHKSVFTRMRDEYGPVWYDQIRGDNGELIGEDISFCIRAGALGLPIHVHTGVRTTHMKHLWLGEQDFWDQHRPPPAREPVAVLVPVMNRPQNADPFMASVRSSTGLANVYAVYGEDDLETRDAWKRAGANTILATGPSFATKVNDGYRATNEPYLFLVGDDVTFWPGWYDHLILAQGVSGCQVVGANDLGNPRVMRGEHATHMLIRRDYVAEHGASWDGPGIVCHEGYHHWFVDDEIVTVAKERNTFTVALGSKVEHLHPIWGKAIMDDTYERGTRYQQRDQKHFAERLKAPRVTAEEVAEYFNLVRTTIHAKCRAGEFPGAYRKPTGEWVIPKSAVESHRMHTEVYQWVAQHATTEPVTVLDIGGMDVNGSSRALFPNATYVALDLYDGEGVDIVADATDWIPDREYDVVVTTGMLEHLEGWRDVLDTAYKALHSGGQLLCTCAGPGWKHHGSHGEAEPPGGEWYENIDPADMHLALAGWDKVSISLGGCYEADVYVIAYKP